MPCFATASEAQEYNSFVISVPYEVSLPSKYTSIEMGCELANGLDLNTSRPWISTRIPLQNGQASGIAKFGYDLFGATPDLISLSDSQIVRFRSIYCAGDFDLYARCSFEQLFTASEDFRISHSIADPSFIVDANDNRAEALDESGATAFSHLLTPAEHEAAQNQPPSPAAATAVTTSPGLQGLQSILEGQ